MIRDTSLALFALLVAAIGLVTLIFIVPAPGSTVCLTKREARHLWPRQHIYWYSSDHCWSNRRGPPRNIKVDPVIHPIRAEAKSVPEPSSPRLEAPLRSDLPMNVVTDGCCWPVLTEFDLRWAGVQ